MKKRGVFLGIPYDWRIPNWKKIRDRVWNSKVDSVFVPKTFGWGYTINWYALLKKLGLKK